MNEKWNGDERRTSEYQLGKLVQGMESLQEYVKEIKESFDKHDVKHVDVETRIRKVENYQNKQTGLFGFIGTAGAIVGGFIVAIFNWWLSKS